MTTLVNFRYNNGWLYIGDQCKICDIKEDYRDEVEGREEKLNIILNENVELFTDTNFLYLMELVKKVEDIHKKLTTINIEIANHFIEL
jgi:hypothetical protein